MSHFNTGKSKDHIHFSVLCPGDLHSLIDSVSYFKKSLSSLRTADVKRRIYSRQQDSPCISFSKSGHLQSQERMSPI